MSFGPKVEVGRFELFFFETNTHTHKGKERGSNTKAQHKLHSKAMEFGRFELNYVILNTFFSFLLEKGKVY